MATGRMTTSVMLATLIALVTAGVAPASAQGPLRPWTDRGFLNVNGGTQTKARQVTTGGSQFIFDETATWDATVGVGSAGIFDIAGGYRVWRNVAAAIGYSRYKDSSGASVNASIPDNLVFDMPHNDGLTTGGLAHSENAVHLSAVLVVPIIERLEVSVFAGPSFFSVTKDIVTDIQVDQTTETLAGAVTTRLDESATGGHIALDIRYRLLDQLGPVRSVGVGVFVRYSGASFDTAQVDKIEVGGLNYGGGIRVGF